MLHFHDYNNTVKAKDNLIVLLCEFGFCKIMTFEIYLFDEKNPGC